MYTIRTMWMVLVVGGVLAVGLADTLAAPPEPIQPGQRLFTLSPAPLQVLTETQAVVGPAVELAAERVQGEWIWVAVRGWVRTSQVELPPGGLLQSGQTLVTRSEAPLQVESETRAVVLPGRKLSFEQAQGDWLWVAVEGWCQAGYLAKEPPALEQAVPPAADSGWQYQQQPSRSYYYYYYDSSPYGTYPSYRYYYRYWPDYYRYWPRPRIDVDIDIYRYWPPDRYRPPYHWPDRPPYRPDGSHRPDGPPHHPPSKLDGRPKPSIKSDTGPKLPTKLDSGPKLPIKSDTGPKLPGKLEPAPKAPGPPKPAPKIPGKLEPGLKSPKGWPHHPKVSLHQLILPPGDRVDRPGIKTLALVRHDSRP
ncbi:MAG TPA: hypothetical protein PK777_05035 [Thermoguttaceae bacterium]|nr:hypothetical protein [Thermoguttaceae bacterium]